ncbi:MAG: hypothetical protein JRJ08_04090 [Deltaproteobacteria bacterium]|nr:hypothetical protein [Deltaproteobacteria bacterium]
MKEGKVNLYAAHEGLLRINIEGLEELNLLGEVMCATHHNNSLVKKVNSWSGQGQYPY